MSAMPHIPSQVDHKADAGTNAPERSLAELSGPVDLAIVGAGPAGLNAAIAAGEAGLRVLLIDDQATPGGQIFHGLLHTPLSSHAVAREERGQVRALACRLVALGVPRLSSAAVWSLEAVKGQGFELGVVQNDVARLIPARRVLLAGGAMERPFPVPGWTLPGVMTAGAAQHALKAQGLVPQGRIVLAGSGPLLRLVAHQFAACGVEITALLETTPRGRVLPALRHLPAFLASSLALKALPLVRPGGRRVRRYNGVTELAIEGDDRVEAISFRCGHGRERISADVVLLHRGLVPEVTLARSAGCRLEWDEMERTFRPLRNAELESSIPGLAIAGDGAGIGGAAVAGLEGEIAGLVAARALGRLTEQEAGARLDALQVRRHRLLSARAFPDALFRPSPEAGLPVDEDTLICRCESVRAGEISRLAADNRLMPDQIKALSRCGMGPCQGRQCLGTLAEIVAHVRGLSPADIGLPRPRGPVAPLRLGALAGLGCIETAPEDGLQVEELV